MVDMELEQFKIGIDLRAYAETQGYVLDRKDSSTGSSVMRHPDGDKIIVKRDLDGHYVYFSVRGDRVSGGTIIDFVCNRKRLTLGQIRKELRPWVNFFERPPLPAYPALKEVSPDRLRVESAYAATVNASRHSYLENQRCLPASLLQCARFEGRIRADCRGNAIFPHFDLDGLCGFEIKNCGFTGFSASGTKGLWLSHELSDDERLVVTESAIDALSYAALFGQYRTRFASIGGMLNRNQPTLIRAAMDRMPAGSEIVSGMDADAAGASLAALLRTTFDQLGRDDLSFKIQTPEVGKDFNDQLQGSSRK